MAAPNLQLLKRNVEFNFVHTVFGMRQSNGHTLELPESIGNTDEDIKAYIHLALFAEGYKKVTSIEIDVDEILQEV